MKIEKGVVHKSYTSHHQKVIQNGCIRKILFYRILAKYLILIFDMIQKVISNYSKIVERFKNFAFFRLDKVFLDNLHKTLMVIFLSSLRL